MSDPIGVELPVPVRERIERALGEKQPGTEWLFTNRLILESSPYLLQHARNPVNWFAWGEEAFAEARRLDRPILLSVGYSTCHWCHVMERESFEDQEIARVMNERYVCIKVDREERPDVDAIYMNAVQQMHGSGGWPMTVWLTPDQRPFFAGTYFPPRDGARGRQRGFLSLLRELAEMFRSDRASVDEAAGSLTQAVRESLAGEEGGPDALPDGRIIGAVVEHLLGALDPVHGGTRGAPKFPSSMPVRLLLRYHARTQDPGALHAAALTLEKMAAGGICDQLGGGFHRYSVDAAWLVPHFEKMLYDNALLAIAYCEAHQVTARADLARVARETLDYLLREMASPEGGFYSATDADSEGEEGKFFVWSEEEIRDALGPDAQRFIDFYGVTPGGNFEGENILFVPHPSEAERDALGPARAKLYAIRSRRIPPLRDDKILAAWNGLAISAFATGARVLREPRFLEAASRAASFVLDRMRDAGRLMRSYKDGRAQLRGYLSDHAFVVAGLLDLYESSFERRWLEAALALANEVEAHFADGARGGWFMTADDAEPLLAREKPSYDGAEPSGTSIQVMNALRLAELTQDEKWRTSAERALAAFAPVLAPHPLAMTELLLALDFARSVPKEIVFVWPDGARLPDDFAAVLAKAFMPARVIAGSMQSEVAALAKSVPLMEDKRAIDGVATAYVCERGACRLPVSSGDALERELAR